MAIEEYIGVLDAPNFWNVNNDNDCEAEGGPEIPVSTVCSSVYCWWPAAALRLLEIICGSLTTGTRGSIFIPIVGELCLSF